MLAERGPWVLRQRVLHRILDAEEEASRDQLRPHVQITPLNYEFQLLGGQFYKAAPHTFLRLLLKS